MKIFYYIKRFWEIPGIEKRLLLKGLLFACWIKFCIILLPYRWYLNPKMIKSIYSNNTVDFHFQNILIARKTVKRLLNILPWKVNCIGKVIILKNLLCVFGIAGVVNLSVKIKDNTFVGAHAYLTLSHNYHIYKQPGFADILS